MAERTYQMEETWMMNTVPLAGAEISAEWIEKGAGLVVQ